MKEKGKGNSILLATPSKDGVASMFDQISSKYELINALLSCGIDRYWRNTLNKSLQSKPSSHLDLATGTGQVLLEFAKAYPTIQKSIGLDPSPAMLQVAKEKVSNYTWPNFTWIQGYAESLPLEKDSFDLVTMSFGIRNTVDPLIALQEMYRVLKKDGTLLIMEFSIPQNKVLCPLYLFYLRKILPLLGGLLSGKKSAYEYLAKTIQTFPHGKAFEELLVTAGFSKTKTKRLTFGIVSIYQAFKP